MTLDPPYIVGAGKVGCTLALALRGAGVPLAGLWTRSAAGAERASALLDLPCDWGNFPAHIAQARTLLVTVVDPHVNHTAGALLDGGLLRSARYIFHCGGGRPADRALSNLRGALCGPACYHLGTLHPLLAFADPLTTSNALAGAFFGVEGDPEARATARELIAAMGAQGLEFTAEQMALYHCAAVMASNQAIGLWSAASEVLRAAGVPASLATTALLPLIHSTVQNLSQEGIPQALTGPVRRGEVSAIEDHLTALAEKCPQHLHLYRAATRATVAVTQQLKDPPGESLLEQILSSVDSTASK